MVRARLWARAVEVHIEGVLLHGHVQQVLQVHAHLDIGLVRGRLLGVERAAVTNLSHSLQLGFAGGARWKPPSGMAHRRSRCRPRQRAKPRIEEGVLFGTKIRYT